MTIFAAMSHVPNLREPLPGLLTAGQPSADDFAAAYAAGARAVIDLRDPMEPRPFHEAEALASLGMEYCNVPVVSGALTDKAMEQFLAALRAHQDQPVIVHCASANRVGGALIPYFMIDKGMTEQAAVDLAMQVGLRSAELMEWGLGYARRHGG